jgi:hypothetical protein
MKTYLYLLLAFFFCTNAFAQTPSLTFSEINYNSDSTRSSGDWIELHNFGSSTVDVSGWKLQDESGLPPFVLPTSTLINPNGYLVIYGDETKFTQQYPTVTNKVGIFSFLFNNDTETISLLNAANTLQLSVTYSDTTFFPQCADGLGRTLELKNTNTNANLNEGSSWQDGCMGGSPGQAYTPCQQPIVFNEINYKSPVLQEAGDWIELKNNTATNYNLSGWKITDANNTNEFVFAAGTNLPANGYLVICASLTAFNVQNPGVSNKIGNFLFGLSGNGDVLRLYDNIGRLHLSMVYNDAAPWPLPPDGEGPTLQLNDPNGSLNDPANWYAGCNKGTPGLPNSPGLSIQLVGSNLVCNTNPTKTYSVTAIAGSTYQWAVTGGTILSGQGSNQVTVQWNTGTGTISVTQTTP